MFLGFVCIASMSIAHDGRYKKRNALIASPHCVSSVGHVTSREHISSRAKWNLKDNLERYVFEAIRIFKKFLSSTLPQSVIKIFPREVTRSTHLSLFTFILLLRSLSALMLLLHRLTASTHARTQNGAHISFGTLNQHRVIVDFNFLECIFPRLSPEASYDRASGGTRRTSAEHVRPSCFSVV